MNGYDGEQESSAHEIFACYRGLRCVVIKGACIMGKEYSRENLVEMIKKAMWCVYRNEYWLIEQECHELNIVGAFYHYFRCMFDSEFKECSIDMEYSKQGRESLPKEIKAKCSNKKCSNCGKDDHKHRIRSDFVIHHRGDNTRNILTLEFKGEWAKTNGNCDWDFEKLKVLTRKGTEEFSYSYGGFVKLEKHGVTITWFEDGEMGQDTKFGLP